MPLWTQRVTGQARVLHGLVVEVILLPQIRCVGLLIIVDVLERFDLRADLLLVLVVIKVVINIMYARP